MTRRVRPRSAARIGRRTFACGAATSVLMGAAWTGAASAAATAVPCGGQAGGGSGLVAALHHANATAGPDTIDLVAGCTYVLTVADNPGNGLPVVTGALTIHGHGATVTRSSPSPFRILEVAAGADVAVDRLTVSGGRAEATGATAFGGGILNGGRLTMTRSTVRDNLVVGVGGSAGGGGIANNGTVVLRDSVLSANRAKATGTQIFAAVGGGVLNRTGAVLRIVGGAVEDNTAASRGSSDLFFIASAGGIGNTGTLAVSGTQIRGNTASAEGRNGQANGAGVSVAGGTADIGDSVIAGNTATAAGEDAAAHGGGLENNGQTVVARTPVRNNRATGPTAQGGGIFNGRRLTLVDSPVTGNAAVATAGAGQGGGIFSESGHVILRGDSPVTGNQPDNCEPSIPGC
jgi:hypothetical protein